MTRALYGGDPRGTRQGLVGSARLHPRPRGNGIPDARLEGASRIPPGMTVSYTELAAQVGAPKAVRASQGLRCQSDCARRANATGVSKNGSPRRLIAGRQRSTRCWRGRTIMTAPLKRRPGGAERLRRPRIECPPRLAEPDRGSWTLRDAVI